MAEIIASLEALTLRTHVFAALDTLEFLRRSGRMNGTVQAWAICCRLSRCSRCITGTQRRKGAHQQWRYQALISLLSDLAPWSRWQLYIVMHLTRGRACANELSTFCPQARSPP